MQLRQYISRSIRLVVGLFLILLLEPTRCGPPPINVGAAVFPPALTITEGETAQGFSYLFGGISSNEREALEERAKSGGYNAKFIFAEKAGSFVTAVTVVITDSKGAEVVSVTSDGPWFYVQLPAGNYSVKAVFQGQTKQVKNLIVRKNKSVQQTFVWDLGEEPRPKGN